MKDFRKIVLMQLTGLAVALVIYPLFHETGHSVAALLVGGEITEYHVFPAPRIACNVAGVSSAGKAMIGISGMLFPIVVTAAFPHPQKRFFLWYAMFIFKGICALSIILSLAAAFFYSVGWPIANEDITTTLFTVPNTVWPVITAHFLVLGSLIGMIAKEKPLKKIEDYLLKQ